MLKHFCLFLLLTCPLAVFAEAEPRNPIQPESVIAAESITKMITGLLLVLAIILIVAWLLKRFANIPATATGHIKIVAAASIGQRERVVIVEIGETHLVLGVTPGQINTLHSMEKTSLHATGQVTEKSGEQFSEVLKNSISDNKP
ncbi:MAG: flagellar biosynthetic protein FliO [Burkholderiales bacterium]|uniref:flagellar biosynthetic protein FliO n=1 Tax=Nitrosomonas sp. TaxID=42353 RepID=UPI001D1D47D7|nr:flagellar biosynthetic protein FliO [Nitrosomonas sp.]MCB1947868.1 flagellar biosynthetic protein FliO [Nitrosomonas sp.]MCP5243261.1 flagellar biosynthetic protein FliO [Burkholderiales bacterium]